MKLLSGDAGRQRRLPSPSGRPCGLGASSPQARSMPYRPQPQAQSWSAQEGQCIDANAGAAQVQRPAARQVADCSSGRVVDAELWPPHHPVLEPVRMIGALPPSAAGPSAMIGEESDQAARMTFIAFSRAAFPKTS